MIIVCKPEQKHDAVNVDAVPTWSVYYCISSPTFKTTYFEKVSGMVPAEAVTAVTQPGHDLADGFVCDIVITGHGGKETMFRAEFFCNTYNIFALLTPVK